MTGIPDSAAIPEIALRARQMYSEGATTRDIIDATGLSHWTLYHWIEGGPKKDGKRLLPPLVKRRMVTRRRILKEDRLTLVNRMMRAAKRQVGEIEQRLAGSGQALGERERDARTLALLAKTLQSLTALDALHEPQAGRPKSKMTKDDTDKDAIPASIDALRQELSRRLAGMAGSHPGRVPRDSDH
ncbi:MAG: hypothetical protein ACOY5F_05305 [Pseudomonadota bacterium]